MRTYLAVARPTRLASTVISVPYLGVVINALRDSCQQPIKNVLRNTAIRIGMSLFEFYLQLLSIGCIPDSTDCFGTYCYHLHEFTPKLIIWHPKMEPYMTPNMTYIQKYSKQAKYAMRTRLALIFSVEHLIILTYNFQFLRNYVEFLILANYPWI